MSKQAVRNQDLASDVYRRNLLVNGGFRQWQRGIGPFTTNSAYTADRWSTSIGAGSTMSVTKQTGTGAGVPVASIAYTHGAVSALEQDIWATDNDWVKGATVTFSALVWSNTPNAAQLRAFTSGTGAVPVVSAFHPGDSTYRFMSVTITVPADAGVLGLQLFLSASCTAIIGNAMLVLGSIATSYFPLQAADDLARCMRYYEFIGANANGDLIFGGFISPAAGSYMRNSYTFKAQKPVVPTVTKVGTWAVSNCGQPTVAVYASVLGFMSQISPTASVTDTYALNTPAGTYITVEANP